MKKGRTNPDSGIRDGLKAAFLFLIVSVVLRYSIPLSVLFSAIGGTSVGVVLSWWESQEPAQPRRNLRLRKITWEKQYPNIDSIATRASRKGSLNEKSPEETPED